MKRVLFTYILSVLVFTICNSQVAIFQPKSFTDSISQPGLIKYGLKLSFPGLNIPVSYRTTDQATNAVYFGDSIPNLFNSNGTCSYGLLCEAFNPNNINDIYAQGFMFPKQKNRIQVSLMTPATVGCNGGMQVSIDSISNCYQLFNSSYSTFWIPGMPFTFPFVSDVHLYNGVNISNNINTLCNGKYSIFTMQNRCGAACTINNEPAYEEVVNVYIGQSSFPVPNNLNIMVNPYHQASPPACDGKASVSVGNSTLPFLCSFDNGLYSSVDSISNLCAGIHTVKVKNATDSASKYFIIADVNSVINNSNPFSQVVDTIVYNLTNCNFNYNNPIDSASLISCTTIDTNTIFLSWQIWQAGISTSVSDTISYNYQAGNNMISLMIFCGNARMINSANFKTFRINDYKILTKNYASIKSLEKNQDFKLFPNPFMNFIILNAKDINDIKSIEMINLLGEVLDIKYQLIDQEIVLDTDNLMSGFYTISIIGKSGKKSAYKVVKQ